MSNQAILWISFIPPWLTLLFMKREDIKRFMPAALFTALSTIIITDAAATLNWFVIRDNIFPLHEVGLDMIGIHLILTIWVLTYTYKRFWLYVIVQLLLSLVFAYLILPWLDRRAIVVWINFSSSLALLIGALHFISIYLYQMWQEDDLVPVIRKLFSAKLQPAFKRK